MWVSISTRFTNVLTYYKNLLSIYRGYKQINIKALTINPITVFSSANPQAKILNKSVLGSIKLPNNEANKLQSYLFIDNLEKAPVNSSLYLQAVNPNKEYLLGTTLCHLAFDSVKGQK
jgi:hypothetical protein